MIENILTLFFLSAALILGFISSTSPDLSFLYLPAGILAFPVLLDTRFRLLGLIFAGLFSFGATNELSLGKILFFALYLVVLLASIGGELRLMHSDQGLFGQHVTWAGFAFTATTLLSGFVNNEPANDIVRSGLPYLLVSTIPIIGLTSGRSFTAKEVLNWTYLLGVISAFSTAVIWVSRRGYSAIDLTYISYGGLALPALAFALALFNIGRGDLRSRLVPSVTFVLIGALMLIPGTRTNYILLAPLVLFFASRSRAEKTRNYKKWVAMLLAIAFVAFISLVPLFVLDPSVVFERLTTGLLVGVTNTQADQSGAIRSAGYDAAWQLVSSKPFFGRGFALDIFYAVWDTPVSLIVAVGYAGTIIIAIYTFFVTRYLSFSLKGDWGLRLAALGWGLTLLADLPFGNPLQDKGLPFALLLLMLLSNSREKTAAS